MLRVRWAVESRCAGNLPLTGCAFHMVREKEKGEEKLNEWISRVAQTMENTHALIVGR